MVNVRIQPMQGPFFFVQKTKKKTKRLSAYKADSLPINRRECELQHFYSTEKNKQKQQEI
ncbi:hypothetical protein CHH71_13770 [Shouchella clausii]|nr:hypothetical protein CHH71_13770 [Shouchella clausii]